MKFYTPIFAVLCLIIMNSCASYTMVTFNEEVKQEQGVLCWAATSQIVAECVYDSTDHLKNVIINQCEIVSNIKGACCDSNNKTVNSDNCNSKSTVVEALKSLDIHGYFIYKESWKNKLQGHSFPPIDTLTAENIVFLLDNYNQPLPFSSYETATLESHIQLIVGYLKKEDGEVTFKVYDPLHQDINVFDFDSLFKNQYVPISYLGFGFYFDPNLIPN